MRYLLPAVAAATALSIGLAPAAQNERKGHHERSRSHVSLHLSTHAVVAGNGLAVRGKVRPSGRHRVKLVFRGRDTAVRSVTTKANGTFALRWVPERTGTHAVRAYAAHDRRIRASRSVPRKLTTYRFAHASYYGPGLYGNGVACGGTLMPGTMGVAHKTLPCGKKVAIAYGGRIVIAPVVDRGPFVKGVSYDLTEKTARALRMLSTSEIRAGH